MNNTYLYTTKDLYLHHTFPHNLPIQPAPQLLHLHHQTLETLDQLHLHHLPPTQLPTINTGPEPPKTDSFQTTLAVISIIIIVVIGISLLVYFKKHKHPKKFTFNEE